MAARNDETWLFVVEWFDPMPRLKRMYLLKYFVQQHQVEMVDVKSKKMFLKKSPCTEETSPEDFGIGKKILLFSRELDIIDYGDLATRQKLELQQQQAVLILSYTVYQKWGLILDQINQILTVLALKSVFPPEEIADRIVQICSENNGNRSSRKSSMLLSEGVCFCILLSGKDAINTVSDFASQNNLFGSESVFIGDSVNQVRELTDLIFDGKITGNNGNPTRVMPVSVSLDNCTCCLVKPHAFKSRDTGRILDMIIARGYEVSAIMTLNFDKTQAEEFLDVYKGVVPDFNDQVLQLSSGTCVALEVRAEDAVEVFRETAGPWDVSMAKELRPKSIRGTFGESNVRSAVHCTDLLKDGVADCEYCFRYMS